MANVETANVGDRATPQWTWTVGGSPTDPTTIVVTQQDADGLEAHITTASSPGTLTTASTPLARVSAGVFKLNPGVSLTESGYWIFRAVATGTAESAPPDFVYKVLPSEFASDAGLQRWALVGLQETKDWLQQRNIEVGDELELVRVINDISARFQDEAGREFRRFDTTASPTVRLFSAVNERMISVGDLSTTPTLVRFLDKDGTAQATIAAGDMILHPQNRTPWDPVRRIQFSSDVIPLRSEWMVEVTGVWGFPSVPGNVRQAVLDAIAVVMDRDVEHYRQDLSPQTSGEGQNVVVFAGRPQMISLPPSSLAVARAYQDPLVA